MENAIIVVILLVIICIAIVPTVKHFKGKGSCCGGSSYKPKKKKLDHIVAKKVFRVEGMHCENCSDRVMESVNDISGVSAIVNWKKGIAEVSYAEPVDDAVIIEKIQRAGYTTVK